MRYISSFEIIIKRLLTEEQIKEISQLKKLYPSAFILGGIGKRGGLPSNLGARFILNNNVEGIFVFHKLIEISEGIYEAYAKLFITDVDIPVIRYCDGMRNHKTVYTIEEKCPICGRNTKKCTLLNKDCKEQLKELRVSLDDL